VKVTGNADRASENVKVTGNADRASENVKVTGNAAAVTCKICIKVRHLQKKSRARHFEKKRKR
jgi:hypothetical protein